MWMNRLGSGLLNQSLAQARRRMCTAAETYTEKMDKTGRPLSPHLMIYKLPTIAVSSITVRITGVIGSFLCIGIAGATIVGDGETTSNIVQAGVEAYPGLVTPAKFAVAWPLVYHWFSNLRHTCSTG